MRLLEVIREAPRPCSYLPDLRASLEHRILVDVTPLELEALLERGWRRFGPDYFRPRCPSCSLCLPTRVPVADFEPSKSQRRARARCEALDVRIGVPRLDDARLDLYHRWHAFREDARGWDEATLSEEAYRFQFTFRHPAARELAYYDPAGNLVGVALCDHTPRAWSAIYFFYDPAWAKSSIGTANVVRQIDLARALGIPYVYLGFRVDACPSLAYKASFRPQEVLSGLPEDHEEPTWALSLSARSVG
jgi:leucyl-tRNA---protein transferase